VIVSALEADPRRRESTRILIDGRPAWTVPADVVRALALRVGEPVPARAVEALDAAADEEGALRAGLRMLERRAHSRRELARKLTHRGHADAAVAAAIGRLERLRLLDDARFAEQYVVARAARGRGPARLRRDLEGLGVPTPVIDRAMGQLGADPALDPWQRTLAQAARRATAMADLPRATRVRRLGAFLARRGFADDRAREAVDRLAGGDEAG